MSKFLVSLIAMALLLCVNQANAATYIYTGANYISANGPYDTSMSTTGSVTTSSPIPPNSNQIDISPLITSWTFSDGVNTLSDANGTLNAPYVFPRPPLFTTDGSGNVTMADIWAFDTPTPAALGDVNDVMAILGSLSYVSVINDAECTNIVGDNICNDWSAPAGDAAANTGGTWTSAVTYTIGGTISGLLGNVTLQNNGGDDLVLNTNGDFTFDMALEDSSAYLVTVSSQPVGQTCVVTNDSGNLDGADVTSVVVTCTDQFLFRDGFEEL